MYASAIDKGNREVYIRGKEALEFREKSSRIYFKTPSSYELPDNQLSVGSSSSSSVVEVGSSVEVVVATVVVGIAMVVVAVVVVEAEVVILTVVVVVTTLGQALLPLIRSVTFQLV